MKETPEHPTPDSDRWVIRVSGFRKTRYMKRISNGYAQVEKVEDATHLKRDEVQPHFKEFYGTMSVYPVRIEVVKVTVDV